MCNTGILIVAAAKRKREKQKHFNKLANQIRQLENAHLKYPDTIQKLDTGLNVQTNTT